MITDCEMYLKKNKNHCLCMCLVLVTTVCCHPVLELSVLLFFLEARTRQAMVPKRSRAKRTLTIRC